MIELGGLYEKNKEKSETVLTIHQMCGILFVRGQCDRHIDPKKFNIKEF